MTRICLASLVVFCSVLVALAAPSPWPPSRPADFHLSFSRSGGMAPVGTTSEVKAGAGASMHRDRDRREAFVFVPENAELDAIYKVLADNRLDEIKTGGSVIYDAPSTGLYVSWGKTTFNAASGAHRILPEYSVAFSTCVGAADRLFSRYSAKATARTVLSFDKSLSGREVTVSVADVTLYNEKPTGPATFALRAAPGAPVFHVTVQAAGRTLTGQAAVAAGKTLHIAMAGDVLKLAVK